MNNVRTPLPEVDIEANLKAFFENPSGDRCLPNERSASFDYCYNYFQGFRAAGRKTYEIATPENLEMSCLQLGFYLASWGMYRGKSFLLQRSVRHLSPLIQLVAEAPGDLWDIDVDRYDNRDSIDLLLSYEERIRSKISSDVAGDRKASEILTTKVMLGIFGNIPAFDTRFTTGFSVRSVGRESDRKSVV